MPKVYKPTPSISTDFSPISFNLTIFSSSESLLDKILDASVDNEIINSEALFDQELFVKKNRINIETKMFFKIFIT